MRSINLAKVAAEAELLRLRSLMARQGRRAAFGVGAVIFLLAALALAEVAGWQELRRYVEPISVTLILLAVNLLIALLLGLPAMRSSPGAVEREALRVRRQALDGVRGALSVAALIPAASTVLGLRRSRKQHQRLGFRRSR